MAFDSSKAWTEATGMVSANRDVLLALAGVFLVLPLAALAVFVPAPEPPAGAQAEQIMELMGAYYRGAWPAYVIAAVVSSIGSLAMLALFTDRGRPTVGEAIRIGAVATPSVIAAQVLLGMGLALAAMVPLTLAMASGQQALAVLVLAGALLAAVWLWVRCSLVSPAVVVDGLRNPIAALQRSWRLTRGNAGRLLAFFVLVAIAFIISIWVVQMVLGLAVTLVLPGEAGRVAVALIGAVLQAVMSVYFVAVFAASHGQLAGTAGQ